MAEWQGVAFKAHFGAKPTRGSTPGESWLWALENELEEMALAEILTFQPVDFARGIEKAPLHTPERRALRAAAKSGDVRILQAACFYLLGEGD